MQTKKESSKIKMIKSDMKLSIYDKNGNIIYTSLFDKDRFIKELNEKYKGDRT